MADDLEKGSAEGITLRDKAMLGYSLLESVLEGASGLLKLQLGLQTGAVVLFVKVLTDVRSPTLVLATLAVSIFLFGASAVMCLNLLCELVEVRAKMLSAWSGGKNSSAVLSAEIKVILSE